jgi:Ca2+-transporting ATPase
MSVLVRERKTSKNLLFTKGNPGIVLKSCSDYMTTDGKVLAINAAFNATVESQIRQLADAGLRVLALAYKESDRMGVLRDLGSSEDILNPAYRYLKDLNNYNFIESELTFLGLVGISDPVRPEAKSALKTANAAGISVFMITGDISETAVAIAKDLDMVGSDANPDTIGKGTLVTRLLFTPADFELLSESQRQTVLRSAIDAKRSLIFAKATPQFKRNIVKTLTGMNEIVAMTGDGVNDAPALKQSSIGISMGITGTEVAKDASDLILLDDNFSTIVTAVEEGRSIYANMKAFIRYMISSNIGEVVSIFLQSILGIPEGFNSIQLLWVNLVTDGLPATALSFNPVDIDIMTKPPRKSTDRIVDDWTLKRYLVIGTYVGIATVGIFVYYYVFYTSPNSTHTLISFWELRNWTKCEDWSGVVFRGYEVDPCEYFISGKRKASTLSLTVLTIIEMFNAVNALSENQSIISIGFFSNIYLLQAIALSVALHCIILYVPFFNTLFSVVPLDIYDWGLVLAFSFPVVIIEEYLKKLTRDRSFTSQKIKAE